MQFYFIKRDPSSLWGFGINENHMKLWQKDNSKLDSLIENYTVGDDYVLDNELMPYDIKASLAHAKGLQEINILSEEELKLIESALAELQIDWQTGKIQITIADEDCHTVIENYLVDKIGEAGKKIHTGRSRNDQVLVVLRLYMLNSVIQLKKTGLDMAKILLNLAQKYQTIPLPGYSHTQQAMLSSVGHYYSAILESLLDDLDFLDSVKKQLDKSPLGSAAGFGVSLPLARQSVGKSLGFADVQVNSLYCQNSRGKFESIFLEGLSQIMLTLSRLATDLLFFTSYECQYFNVDSSLITGSSIMPHKKNLDGLEILRANASVIISNQLLIKDLVKNLMSGYNRDLQLMKKPLFESVKIVKASLAVAQLYLQGLKPDEEIINKKINTEIFMADCANKLVKEKGLPFREAYTKALTEYLNDEINLAENLKSKISLGAPGNLGLELYEQRIADMKNSFLNTITTPDASVKRESPTPFTQ